MTATEQLRACAVALAARDLDHAFEQNGVGFNQSDTWYGHGIAALPAERWTPEVAAHAHRVLRKYARQLEGCGIDFAAIPDPGGWDEGVRERAREHVAAARRDGAGARIAAVVGGYEVRFAARPGQDVLDEVKAIPGRRWDAERRCWCFPASSAAALAAWGAQRGTEGAEAIGAGAGGNGGEPEPAAPETRPARRIERAGPGFAVRFPYDPDLVATVKREVPGARWDRDARVWTIGAGGASALARFAAERGFAACPELDEAAATSARRAEALVKIGALRQVAARGKLAAVKEWVEDFLASGEKLVLFAHHVEVQRDLLAAFPGAASILGEHDPRRRADEVARFQDDPDCRLIVASTAAGGVGIELTAASNVAFVELEWRPADHDQAEDRAYGRLNDPHGLVAWFLAEGTIDEDMAELVDAKRAVVDAATDGREGTTGGSILGALVARMLERSAS